MQALSARIPDLAYKVLVFISKPPCSETPGTDFRKPMLNTAPQEPLKLCEYRRFGIQTPGSSSPPAAGKILQWCLSGWEIHGMNQVYQLALLKGIVEQNMTHENADLAKEVSL